MYFFRPLKFYAVVVLSLLLSFDVFAKGENKKIDSLKALLTSTVDDTARVDVLIALATQLDCSDTPSKSYYLQIAKTLAEKAGWMKGTIDYYLAVSGLHFYCKGEINKAQEFALLADSISKVLNDPIIRRKTLNSVAFYYRKSGKYAQAIDYYERMLAISSEFDERISTLANLGVSYNSIGDYNKAISAYFNSLKILDELQVKKKHADIVDSLHRAGLLANISDLYLSMSQPEKALAGFDSVYKTGISIRSIKVQIIGLIGKGMSLQAKQDFDAAITQYILAFEKCKEVFEPGDQVRILYELTNCYLGKKDPAKAALYAQDALKLAQTRNSESEELLPKVYIALGKVYLQQKEYSNAINYLQQALAIAQKAGSSDDERDAWAALSDAYERTGEPIKALDAYRHFIAARDSTYNIVKANEFARQELDYLYKSREMADKMAYDKRLARQQVFIYAGSAVVLLLVLVSFFAYRNYHTQKKYNELLSREKEGHLRHIQDQDTVLTDIAHIQSHKVRGPIATILGLAQLFNHDDAADPINKEVVTSLTDVTNRLDVVVKEVVEMENRLRAKGQDGDRKTGKEGDS